MVIYMHLFNLYIIKEIYQYQASLPVDVPGIEISNNEDKFELFPSDINPSFKTGNPPIKEELLFAPLLKSIEIPVAMAACPIRLELIKEETDFVVTGCCCCCEDINSLYSLSNDVAWA